MRRGDALGQRRDARRGFFLRLLLLVERDHIGLHDAPFNARAASGQICDVHAVLVGIAPGAGAGEDAAFAPP